MATKLQFYSELAEHVLGTLTSERGNWMRFLETAARLYKYPFQDQVMIYAQRPDATACAELELWNEQFKRWVRRGSKGIALIDDTGSYPRLKYVFDVSDTEPSLYRSKPVKLWEMTQEHKAPVLSELAKNYEDVSPDDPLDEAIHNIALQLANEYYDDNRREIMNCSENSFLEPAFHHDFAGTIIEEADDSALRSAFTRVLANSVAYTVMARCGLEASEYYDSEDFEEVYQFNTADMTNAVGTASSDLSEQVLRDIEITIRKYERVKNAERGETNHDRNIDVQPSRGIPAARHQTERAAEGTDGAAGQVREDEESVPQGLQEDNIQQAASDGDPVPASEGDRASGDGEDVAGDGGSDTEGEPAGESSRPDGLDGGDERLESASGGSDTERADLQLSESETPPDEGGVSLSETSQQDTFSQLGKSSLEDILNASRITFDEVDAILRDGGNFDNHYLTLMPFESRSALRIAAHFAKGLDGNADFLKREYLAGRYGHDHSESGKGFAFGSRRISAWFSEDGIELATGDTVKGSYRTTLIPWDIAAARIDELMRGGRYVSASAYDNALENEKLEIASRLWDFYRDDMHGIPEDFQSESGGNPGDVAQIKSLLEDGGERQRIFDRLVDDVDTWINDLERRSYRDPVQLREDMRKFMMPPVIKATSDELPPKGFDHFVTQDEIDAFLTRGGAFHEGKLRFLSFFLEDHNEKEKLEFVKREYGTGGGTWSDTDGYYSSEPGKGLTLRRGGIANAETEVNLKWNAVIKRTEQLISEGRYATRELLDYIPRYERLMLIRSINSFFYELPAEYERPFPGTFKFTYNEYHDENGKKTLDFNYPRQAEWQAIRDLLDNPERVDALLAQIERIYVNTPEEDRYYSSRKLGFESLVAYREGTYTLFPGLEDIPDPETAALRRVSQPMQPQNEMVENLSDSPFGGLQVGDPPEIEQISLFDAIPAPNLPTVEEQQRNIEQKFQQLAMMGEPEARREPETKSEVKASDIFLANDIDTALLDISDADKSRIAEQFSTDPRSREAVSLVREVYGGNLAIPLPQAVKRIAELAQDGAFDTGMDIAAEPGQAPPERKEWLEAIMIEGVSVFTHKDRIYQYFMDANGSPDLSEAAKFLKDVYGTMYVIRDDLDAFAVNQWQCNETGISVGDTLHADWDEVASTVQNLIASGVYQYSLEEFTAWKAANARKDKAIAQPVPVEDSADKNEPYELFEQVREELSERGFAASGELIEDGLNEYAAQGGRGNAQDVADFIEDEFLSEEPEFAEDLEAPPVAQIPYKAGDRLTYNGKPHQIESTDDIFVRLRNLGTQSAYPVFDFVSVLKRDFERMLSDGEISIEPPNAAEVADTEAELDFDAIADEVYFIVMSDGSYIKAMLDAQSRNSLRIPCALALESAIARYQDDNPELFERYYNDDDFNEDLFSYVLTQSWENRPRQAEPVPVEDKALETAEPYKQGDRFYMDDGSQRVIQWIGNHEISHYSPDAPHISELMDKGGFEDLIQRNPANSHLLIPEAQFAEITDPAVIAETEAIFGDGQLKATAVKLNTPEADAAAHYLFLGADDGASLLSVDTLPLIDEKADSYTVYADICNLSEDEMYEWGITFRKMPRDWNLLPVSIQDQIREIKPEYEREHMRGVLESRGIEPSEENLDRWIEDYRSYRANDYSYDENAGGQLVLNTEQAAAPETVHTANFRITDDNLGEGGAKAKFRANIEALQTLKTIELENRDATPGEQETMSRYVGWGGLPQAFDPDNKAWEDEYLELNALLTPDEWKSAKASTLNAHYTSPTVIKAIYETVGRLGFQTGNILEPACGVGNFFGLLPDSMQSSKLYGVELDSVTARMAKLLYPSADIQETGFEDTQYPDAFFDIAIGNVPFGDFGVIDKRYRTNFKIHDYFFQKTLDKVRPGGVIAFVTSKGTLDKQNPEVRKYIAQRAELLGAVRLPNTAFLKNAGTEVTADILFLQKRDRPVDVEPEWVHLGMTEDGLPVNRYYLDNPEMMLGRMSNDSGTRMYGSETSTSCVPIEGADLAEQLKAALSYIQGEYTVDELEDLDGVDNHAIPADPGVKNFSYTERDGTVYFRENSLMYPVELPSATLERIRGMIRLRDCVQQLIALQLDDYGDSEIKAQQAKLNYMYDRFVSEFGLISSTANSRAFNADSAYYLLSSLEVLDEDGNLERKADMFTKRTIRQRAVVTHCDTATEALAVSLGEKARVDMEYMSNLTGKSEDELFNELRGVIFLDFGFSGNLDDYTYRTADEFLSGNVREKLKKYRDALETVPDDYRHYQAFKDNVEALEAVQPKDLEAGEIGVRLGATWIDPAYVQEFMYELLGTSYRNRDIYQVKYHEFTGEWQVTGKGKAQYSDVNATVTYGTARMNAYQILDDTLNLRDVRVYDTKIDAEGKERRVLNKKETTLAQQKQELIKRKFRDWLWADHVRRQTLVQKYNELFNSMRTREYDGSHITFEGMNPEIKLSKHQIDGAARQIYGGNTLYAHVVGAGKTFTMIASAMESKRLGLCHKSLFAVPNHLTEQWASEFLRLYPSANILVATKKDFEMRNRKKFCAKIATGEYDAVIIGHTQLEKIPMSRERQERQINEQIWEIEEGIRELKGTHGNNFSIKQLEKTKRRLENRLTKLLESKKRDDVVTFEQLGVDRLYVDEAHGFKNLFLYTKMRNVAGLSTTEAQKSSDLFMKCRYMDEITGNKGVIFATGTPISNSMSEMYTMQRYLQHDTLVAKRLIHFDSWASIFGETVTSIELAPEGTGYRARTRFAKFHNLPELMSLFKEVADIQTADMLNLPVPEAKYENIVVEPSETQQEMVQALSVRAARVHARLVEPKEDNMLKITTDGRKIGLDQRLMNPLLEDFEGSKVNACTDKIFEIWNDTKPNRLTQLVFCDFSTPNKDGRFNVYDDIRDKLLARGIPESEIAFIHDADTETKKKELFAKVRQGKVRVLFGSTFKMGAGTNVQDKLIAIHDADCPWRPADLEQRSGRIIRQGNTNPEVQIYRYATSGTFDSYLWQTVQKKQEFIAQIMSSKSPVRSCEDVDETALSYAEIKALCAGNPLIAEKMNLDNEVAKLRMLKAEHKSQHYRLEDNLMKKYPEQITSLTERISCIEKDIAMYAAEKEKCVSVQVTVGGAQASEKFPGMVINGVKYDEKEPAAKALLEACKGITGKREDVPIGEYMGFNMSLRYESFSNQINLYMRGAMTYQIELGTDTFGNITRINNALDKLPDRLAGAKSQLDGINRQVEAAKAELEKPFEQEQELAEKESRLALLNADLNIDGDGGMEMLGETDSRDDDEPYDGDMSDENSDRDSDDDYDYNYRPAAKSKPSILEGIRSYDGTKQSNVQGRDKASERGI